MAAPAPPTLDPVLVAARDVAGVAGDLGRTELVDRLRIAAARVGRPEVVVCVVGEFKQGKSSLVNALVSRVVCPVDDDLATSVVTVLRHGEEVSVTGFRAPGAEPERIDPARLAEVVTERGNPANELGYARVELTFPNPFLGQGVVLVDTPGTGGLTGGHAAAVLGFLPFADALLFVSDLSAELSRPELALLERASGLCPSVVVCLTKLDLYSSAERLVEIDRAHVATAGLATVAVVPLSSHLRVEGLRRKDAELSAESGFDALFEALDAEVIGGARDRARQRLAAETIEVAEALLGGLEPERAALDDPDGAAEAASTLDAARVRLEHLRGPAARWAQVLTDGTADVTNRVTHEFRAALRAVQREGDGSIEEAANADAWTEVVTSVQDQVAATVADAFVAVGAGMAQLAENVRELVAEEGVALELGDATVHAGDVRSLWSERTPAGAAKVGAVQHGLGFVGGVQSGMILVGTLGRLMPAAAATVLVANPVVLGAGLLMGGQKLLEGRKKVVAQRKQAARQALKQFVDDVQFEIGAQLADAVRTAQRQLRDQLQNQVGALTKSQAEAVERMQRDIQATDSQRRARATQLDARITALRNAATAAGQGR